MAKIIVNRENFKVDEIELKQGTLSIGRTKDNDLCIDDLTVSGRHAKIVTVFDSCYVEDLGSTNGSFVNGKRVKTHTLHNGDVLTIGHYQLLFQADAAISTAPGNDTTRMINQSQVEALITQAGTRHRHSEAAAPCPSSSRPTQAPPATKPVPQRLAPVIAAKGDKGPVPAGRPNNVVKMPQPEPEPLPDIEDPTTLIDRAAPGKGKMKPLRKSDTSPLTSLKTIVLAALTAAATFFIMMLLFDL